MGREDKKEFLGKRVTQVALAVALGVILALLLRYGVLENSAQDALCREHAVGVQCTLRALLGKSIYLQLFGLGGVILAVAAWLAPIRSLAMAGLLLSSCGLLLYNATFAAVGFIVALLAALR